MTKFSLACILSLSTLLCACSKSEHSRNIDPVDFSKVHIDDGFWSPRLDLHKRVTIPVCIDNIENRSGRLTNFDKAASGSGAHEGFFYDDSDVYKALEGFAYSLSLNPDPELEAKCDNWISRIAAAQRSDGYLDTWFQLARPGQEWTDMDKHELYCTGHMIEAAIAYAKATGKTRFMEVAEKMVDCAMRELGPGKKDWVSGHEEIELALVKLYNYTGERKYLQFADWLLGERGHGYGVYSGNAHPSDAVLTYYQDKQPVGELTDIYGHAVRAMYLYCGMADVASYTDNKAYLEALDRLWPDVVERNMYITGGIGQSAANEGISEDYDLPNAEAYCETCASIGMVLWNARMNWLSADAKYADVFERSLYNGVLSGISLSGDRFFYDNPLESYGDKHRSAWFGTACCPSNLCRFLPSLGGYIYGTSKDRLYVNLFISSSADFKLCGRDFSITQQTSYPWSGTSQLLLGSSTKADILVRVPGWSEGASFYRNGEEVFPKVEKGYAILEGPFRSGDVLEVSFPMQAYLVQADPRVKADVGKRAVQRGPLVYCAEQVDNPDFEKVNVKQNTTFSPSPAASLPWGILSLESSDGALFVPYFSWCNRGQGRMKVWLDLVD